MRFNCNRPDTIDPRVCAPTLHPLGYASDGRWPFPPFFLTPVTVLMGPTTQPRKVLAPAIVLIGPTTQPRTTQPTKSCRPTPGRVLIGPQAPAPQNPADLTHALLIGPQPTKSCHCRQKHPYRATAPTRPKTQDPRAHKQKGPARALRAPTSPKSKKPDPCPASYQLPACGELCATAISRASSSSTPAPALVALAPPDTRPSGSAEVSACPSHTA